MNKFWVKICHDEGVIFEHMYNSKVEADAFVNGFYRTIEALDIENDDHFACVDSKSAEGYGE